MEEVIVRDLMQKQLDLLTSELTSLRTGRATVGLVDSLVISVYGGTQRFQIKELSSVTAPDAQTLVIDPWDKSIIGEVRQAILAANIGLNPSLDGEIIRISIPPMTGEDRERYVKLLNTKLENSKVAIRQVRADGMHTIKKSYEEKTITEDQKFAQEKRLQELTDEFVGKIESLGEKKRSELLQV